ncbi:hypothetical protein QC761_401334 [Podospora bellae-mahoneyi]|uniref:Ecp2 effector protein domain-containing protein n=1 Tax=Podospora bellae-mahoneyi TaxID=2093777 RepID=A0ABR0FFY4_9PEZI|nr:hypothetical protein QC761_401334 [Podospora bellae-mahoneyi]
MRLSTPLAAAATLLQSATLASAEAWTLFSFIDMEPFQPNWDGGLWHTDFGSHNFKIENEDGCWKNVGVPSIAEVCVDIVRTRAHFIVGGTGQRRCMFLDRGKRGSKSALKCFRDTYDHSCFIELWEEVDCTW